MFADFLSTISLIHIGKMVQNNNFPAKNGLFIWDFANNDTYTQTSLCIKTSRSMNNKEGTTKLKGFQKFFFRYFTKEFIAHEKK